MNAHPSLRKSRSAAFTLIELLTVIAIIAVLMGLLFPVLAAAKDRARRAAASVAVRTVTTACKGYETDNGRFPPVPGALDAGKSFYSYGDTRAGGCAVTNDQLFDILRSINRGVNNNYALNKRQVTYLEVKVAQDTSNPRDGFVDGSRFPGGVQGQLVDPWGAQYCIVLDATSSGKMDLSGFYSDLAGSQDILHASAAVFSMGGDSKRGGKGYQNQLRKPGSGSQEMDDIVSWQ
jgi:prepilin-type N-terminal cleavage/methylation domain-containing protein